MPPRAPQNPSKKRAGAPSAGPEPEYTEPQRKRFKSYSWIDADEPSLLGVEGTEVLLVGAKDDYTGGWVRGWGRAVGGAAVEHHLAS
jgi:hypothetical protein